MKTQIFNALGQCRKAPFLAVLLFVVMGFIILPGLSAQQLNIDEAVVRAARGVEDTLPQGTVVAVLNFASPTEEFSKHVIEELIGELVAGGKVTIVDRRSLELIREEMNLQMSGDVSDESAQAIGRMLGAQSIVSGTLTNMGTFHRFRIMVISVETAAIQTQVSFNVRNDAQVVFLLGQQEGAVRTRRMQGGRDDKWVYLGGVFGVGNSVWSRRHRFETNTFPYFFHFYEEESGPLFAPGLVVDFNLLPFFSIEIILGSGFGFADRTAVPLIPVLAKLGGRIAQMEISFDVGYTIGAGFTLGGTIGMNVGRGILFAKFLSIPNASPFERDNEIRLVSGMMGFLGYKIGFGKK